jgi:hypothetical protein
VEELMLYIGWMNKMNFKEKLDSEICNAENDVVIGDGDVFTNAMNRLFVLDFMLERYESGIYNDESDFDTAWDNVIEELMEARSEE